MIFGRKKRADRKQLEQWQGELADSKRELQDVKRHAKEQAPLLGKLQKHLEENNFAARFIKAVDANRRHA